MYRYTKSKKSLLSIVLFCFISETMTGETSSENQLRPPNVIIFLADDLGYGDLSFTGHPTTVTNNIDKLAQNGKVLTNFYVTSPICSPSRASLLTGRYHVRSGIWPNVFWPNAKYGLPKNETTIANILKNSGYKTKIIGKWHLGVGKNKEYLPGNGEYGFDNYYGIPYPHDFCPCPVCFPNNGSCWEGSHCYAEYVSCPLFSNQDIIDQPVYFPTTSQRFLKQAKDFITKSHKDGSPFFLYLSFIQIHIPQFASMQYAGKSPRGDVGDAILEMDWMIGEVMSLIGTLGIGNKTMSWFTSDNGPSLLEHEHGGTAGLLRCGKGTTWDGGVRVPTVVHWPGKINPGRSNALSSTLDMLPTISNLVGVKNKNLTLDGMDLASVLFDDAEQSPRKFQALYQGYPSQLEGPFAVIFNQYKAHFYTRGSFLSDNDNLDPLCRGSHNTTLHDPPLLFDLYKDPGERYDIGNQTKSREIIKTISEWRKKHMTEVVWTQSVTKIEEDDMEPCCTNSNCSPYPECCDCPSSSHYCDSEDTTC